MTTNAALSGALRAYRQSAQLNRNPIDVLSAVHDQLAMRVQAAKAAYEIGRLDNLCRETSACLQTLSVLEASFDYERAGSDAAALRTYYARVGRAIRRVLRSDSAIESLQSISDMLRPMRLELERRKSKSELK